MARLLEQSKESITLTVTAKVDIYYVLVWSAQ